MTSAADAPPGETRVADLRPAGVPWRQGALGWALLAAGVAWLAWRASYFSTWMDDDAFISFRYARNLVRGHGLVFNPGEYVEGYTNFLWTLLLAGAHALGADLPRAALWLGTISSFLTVLLLALWGPRLLPQRGGTVPAPLALSAALTLCVLEPWAVWTIAGLENVFAALIVLGAHLVYFEYLDGGSRRTLAGAGALCAVAALCHPSYAVFGVVLAGHLLARWARGAERLGRAAWFILPIAVIALPYLAFKLAYYGHVLPNTFYAKVGWSAAALLRGLSYYSLAALAFPILLAAAIAVPACARLGGRSDPRPHLLSAGIAVYCAYGILIGGEAFFAFRLLIVILPLACVLLQYGLVLAAGRLSRERAGWASPLIFAAAAGASAAATWISPRVRVLDDEIARDFTQLCRTSALELARYFPPDTLLAHSGAGAMAYYTDFRFLDTLGLNDATIARRSIATMGQGGAGHEKGNGRYVLSRRPDLVLFSGYPLGSLTPGHLIGDQELFALPEFHASYTPFVVRYRFRPRGGAETIMELPIYIRNGARTR